MKKQTLRQKLRNHDVCVYLRVSTEGQEIGEYKNQLATIKNVCPELKVSDPNNHYLKEFKSGFDPIEKRMASGLGSALRWLQHNPTGIMVVSTADRISRRADVFERISIQGLGKRIFIASTCQSLDDVITAGEHTKIELESLDQKATRQDGIEKKKIAGGYVARSDLKDCRKAADTARKAAKLQRKREVFRVVADIALSKRGVAPTPNEICKELDKRCIRTGQGYFFTVPRFHQFKKGCKEDYAHALGSFRRSIVKRWAGLIRTANLEPKKKRTNKLRRIGLDKVNGLTRWLQAMICLNDHQTWALKSNRIQVVILLYFGLGCRSPPPA